MSTNRRSSTARRSARLSCARISSALERSSWDASPPIWRSISLTIRWVDSRWRSRLLSSSLTSCTWPCSRSRWRCRRSRSPRISSKRRRLSSKSGVPWAASDVVDRTSSSVALPILLVLPVLSNMPEMPPHAHETASEAEQDTKHNDQHHVLGSEEDQTRQRPTTLIAEQQIAGVAQRQRQDSAEQPLQS